LATPERVGREGQEQVMEQLRALGLYVKPMFNLLKKHKKDRKVVVIGLDGVPYTLLKDYIKRGITPELSQLCANASFSR
jgi:hypothetical protein